MKNVDFVESTYISSICKIVDFVNSTFENVNFTKSTNKIY